MLGSSVSFEILEGGLCEHSEHRKPHVMVLNEEGEKWFLFIVSVHTHGYETRRLKSQNGTSQNGSISVFKMRCLMMRVWCVGGVCLFSIKPAALQKKNQIHPVLLNM